MDFEYVVFGFGFVDDFGMQIFDVDVMFGQVGGELVYDVGMVGVYEFQFQYVFVGGDWWCVIVCDFDL